MTPRNVVAAIDARHDNVYLQIFGIGGRTLVAPRVSPLREAVRAAMTGPARLVGIGRAFACRRLAEERRAADR